ncbi:MAG TPA: YdcF family protein, partial [Bryobacteraceae bacterium]|nr:YdcF family protein [Bryobacteraceae bacterium]
RRAWRIATGLLAGIGLLFVFVTITPLVPWWIKVLAGPWREPRGDVLIVLGGSMVDEVIGYSSYWRSVYAIREWQRGSYRRMVITGGGAPVAVSSAMAAFVEAAGVPRGAVQTETDSRSTHENAVQVARILAGTTGRKILLTSDYHMYRAHRCFERAGLDVEPSPIPDAGKRIFGSRLERWPVFFELLAETRRIVYYRVKGWI